MFANDVRFTMQSSVMVGKVQNLFMRIGIDDNLTACLVLACGLSLVVHGYRSRRKVAAYVSPVGTTFLKNEGVM